jgi:hypothetical protein
LLRAQYRSALERIGYDVQPMRAMVRGHCNIRLDLRRVDHPQAQLTGTEARTHTAEGGRDVSHETLA